MAEKPQVSVVVASLNAGTAIEEALLSVVSQRAVNLELLVVDGSSTDGSWELVKQFSEHISWSVSEPDSGIYAAWNKALKQAQGDYLCFLGADDRFASPNALSKLVEASNNVADLISCKSLYRSDGTLTGFEFGSAWNWENLRKGMCVEHRGMLHKQDLFRRFGAFDTSFSIAGDLDFLLRCGPDMRAAFVDEALVIAGTAGVSQRHVLTRLRERKRAQLKNRVRSMGQANVQMLVDLARHFYPVLREQAGRTLRSSRERFLSTRESRDNE